jgi:hypothetical protein
MRERPRFFGSFLPGKGKLTRISSATHGIHDFPENLWIVADEFAGSTRSYLLRCGFANLLKTNSMKNSSLRCFLPLGTAVSLLILQANPGLAQSTAPKQESAPASAEAAVNTLTESEKAQGWRLLFDGKNPANDWRGYKKDELPSAWVVQDGALFLESKGGDIVTKEQFENFELLIDWKISEAGNSGIMFRVQEISKAPWHTGPEIQVLDNTGHRDPNKAAWMYGLYTTSVDATKPVGEWNRLRFVTKNGKCQHWLNDVFYVEYEIGSEDWNEKVSKSKFGAFPDFAKFAKGHLCLQDHGNQVWFRNIKIRPLN